MNSISRWCPSAPEWRVDWPALDREFEWIRAMRGCAQDAFFHAEGDVWIHTRMVCEAMAALSVWRTLPEGDRQVVFAGAVLHDQAKPSCTREENGRITSRGHSVRGAIDARRILWEMNTGFPSREQICALVRHHQAPFHLIDRDDAQRQVFLISQTARCDLLALLARADILGRQCGDREELLNKVSLFEEFCRELNCFDQPRKFASPHSRFEYFRAEHRDPGYLAHEDFRCEVAMMSGLPGAGKDTWIRSRLPECPVISLDAIREELDEPPTGNQGKVIHQARERAREVLRARQDFVWNATNLSREIRGQLVNLFTDYHARVRIIYVEASVSKLHCQNKDRAEAVPGAAISRMMDRWEIPTAIEADAVEWWVDGEQPATYPHAAQ